MIVRDAATGEESAVQSYATGGDGTTWRLHVSLANGRRFMLAGSAVELGRLLVSLTTLARLQRLDDDDDDGGLAG